MQRVKRRIFSGVVCEQEVYTVSDRANIKKAEPRPRFKDDEERAQHRIGISKRKHQRLVNEEVKGFRRACHQRRVALDRSDEVVAQRA